MYSLIFFRKTLTSLKVLNVLSDDDFSASKLIIDIPNLKNLTEDVASTEIWGNKVPNHSNLESMMLIGDTFAYRHLPESFPKLKTVFACSLPEYKLVDFLSSCDESIECLAVSSSKKRYFDDGPKFTRMENLKELYLGNDSLSKEALDDLLTKNCNNLQLILFQFYGVKEINMLKDILVKLLKVKTVIVSTLSVQEDKIRELIGGICPNARVVIGDRRNESHIVREIMAARFKHLKYGQEFQSMFMTYFG